MFENNLIIFCHFEGKWIKYFWDRSFFHFYHHKHVLKRVIMTGNFRNKPTGKFGPKNAPSKFESSVSKMSQHLGQYSCTVLEFTSTDPIGRQF